MPRTVREAPETPMTLDSGPAGGGLVLAYPIGTLWPDYARAGIGLVLSAAPLPWVPADSFGVWLLGGLVLLFGGFAVSTWAKQRSTVRMNAEGILIQGPLGRSMTWRDLRKLGLRFYSTRKQRGHGWLQLKLVGGGRTLKLDSNLERFEIVVARAARAASENGLALDPTTLANLESIGVWPADGSAQQ